MIRIRNDSLLDVGITIFLPKENISIWSNGLNQNIFFLVMMLSRSPRVRNVYLINGGDGCEFNDPLVSRLGYSFVSFEQVKDRLDVLVEMGAQISPDMSSYVRERGGTCIAYRVGNDYVYEVERTLTGKGGPIFNGTRFDEVWTLPAFAHTCRAYYEIQLRCPVQPMTHVWSPCFLLDQLREMKLETLAYRGSGLRPRRFVCMEPNLSVVKHCHTAILAAELAYRRRPDLVEHLHVLNTDHIKDNLLFVYFNNNLDIFRAKRLSFEGRFSLPFFLSEYADGVISSQWENAQNYLYYEVAYLGFPLIHNSKLCRDIGYYYPDFDAHAAAQQMLQAIDTHHEHVGQYLQNARSWLWNLDPANDALRDAYVSRMFALLGVPSQRDVCVPGQSGSNAARELPVPTLQSEYDE